MVPGRNCKSLVTLDKDFGELAIVRRLPHAGILLLVNVPARQQATICAHILAAHGGEMLQGAIITAEAGRLRIRPPEAATPEEGEA